MGKFNLFELKRKIDEGKEKKEDKMSIGHLITHYFVGLFGYAMLVSLTISYNLEKTIEYPLFGVFTIILILRLAQVTKRYIKQRRD